MGEPKPGVGDVAPDFSLAASDGTTVALSSYRGRKNVLLVFYPMDDTPG
jgi:peroxiredoxin Q/BCP